MQLYKDQSHELYTYVRITYVDGEKVCVGGGGACFWQFRVSLLAYPESTYVFSSLWMCVLQEWCSSLRYVRTYFGHFIVVYDIVD